MAVGREGKARLNSRDKDMAHSFSRHTHTHTPPHCSRENCGREKIILRKNNTEML